MTMSEMNNCIYDAIIVGLGAWVKLFYNNCNVLFVLFVTLLIIFWLTLSAKEIIYIIIAKIQRVCSNVTDAFKN